MNMKHQMNWALLIGTLAVVSSCNSGKSSPAAENLQQTTANEAQVFGELKVSANAFKTSNIVCDPFGSDTGEGRYNQGVQADLFYKEDNMCSMSSVDDYIQFAKKSEKQVFLTDINVPTRIFSKGFVNPSGVALTKDSGETLVEYFALKMTTNVMLSSDDQEGNYEFALLSDDGAKLIMKSETAGVSDTVLVNIDGVHQTKMGCSKLVVNMTKDKILPIEVRYFQGPAYHIANVLIWRKADAAGKDSLCNQFGNNLFFNPDNNSAPQKAYKDLLSRGWKPLTANNFMYKVSKTVYNPCVTGTPPVISDAQVGEVAGGYISLSWVTDIPATAQVQVTNLVTGAVSTTDSDNMLRTSHYVTISGLTSGDRYKFEPISISEDLGRTVGTAIIYDIP